MARDKLQVLEDAGAVRQYLEEIRKYPVLEAEEEFRLARAWRDHGDTEAAHKLVTSHLRLAAKTARSYRGYGLPEIDVISEANLGLMRAVKRFDPDKGNRLSTYAIWWIRAGIQEYILRTWSLVKLGTTAAQKRLFFNLRRAKKSIEAYESGDLRPEHVEEISRNLGVREDEVVSMNRRLAGTGDVSLNTPVTGEAGAPEWQDWIEDPSSDHAAELAEEEERDIRHILLIEALKVLDERQTAIFLERRLNENQKTLEDLAERYGVSRERIRQIEMRAYEKVRDRVRELAAEQGLLAGAAT